MPKRKTAKRKATKRKVVRRKPAKPRKPPVPHTATMPRKRKRTKMGSVTHHISEARKVLEEQVKDKMLMAWKELNKPKRKAIQKEIRLLKSRITKLS